MVSIFHDTKMWPRQLHSSSIKLAVVNPQTTTWAYHILNPGKAMPGLNKLWSHLQNIFADAHFFFK